jgi:hypothetical protein
MLHLVFQEVYYFNSALSTMWVNYVTTLASGGEHYTQPNEHKQKLVPAAFFFQTMVNLILTVITRHVTMAHKICMS